jgi:hypothetical protein
MRKAEACVLSYWLQILDFVKREEGGGLLGYAVLTFLLAVVAVLSSDAFGVNPVAVLGELDNFAGSILSAWL